MLLHHIGETQAQGSKCQEKPGISWAASQQTSSWPVQIQVFGSSGARTIKDMLAEAETPRKRALSARTGGGSDFSQGGGGSEAGCTLQPMRTAFQASSHNCSGKTSLKHGV